MMQQQPDPKQPEPQKVQAPEQQKTRTPDDRGSVHVDGFVRIYDPNTQQVFLETRT